MNELRQKLDNFIFETGNRLEGLSQRLDTLILESRSQSDPRLDNLIVEQRNLFEAVTQRLETIITEQRNLASDGHSTTLARVNTAQWDLAEQINQIATQLLKLRSDESLHTSRQNNALPGAAVVVPELVIGRVEDERG